MTARITSTLAIVLFVAFAAALVALHGLRPDYTPVDHMISDYAVGRFGWVMTSAFVFLGLGCLCLAIGLWQSGPKAVLARIGAALLGFDFFGLIVTAGYTTDLETAPETLHGDIHAISFLVNVVSILIAALSLSIGFGKDERWRPARPVALGLAILLVAGFVAQAMTLHKGAPYGITNRIFVVIFMSWLFFVAWRLRSAGDPLKP